MKKFITEISTQFEPQGFASEEVKEKLVKSGILKYVDEEIITDSYYDEEGVLFALKVLKAITL